MKKNVRAKVENFYYMTKKMSLQKFANDFTGFAKSLQTLLNLFITN